MAQQTAVDWYYEQTVIQGRTNYAELLEQAKQMEKEQITDSYIMGSYDMAEKKFRPEQYYNETFGNK